MATGSITSDSTATPKIFSQNPVFDISGIATRPLRSKACSHAISHLDSRSDAARNQKRRNGGQNGDSPSSRGPHPTLPARVLQLSMDRADGRIFSEPPRYAGQK